MQLGRARYILIITLFLSFVGWGQDDFTITFDTQLGAGGNTVILPFSGGTYDVDIDNDGDFTDDGDGGALINVSGLQSIDFGGQGEYTIRIRPNPTNNVSGQLRVSFGGMADAERLLRIDKWGTKIVWTSMEGAFQDCVNMNIAALAGVPNLTGLTSLGEMFPNATSLNQDLSSWNVSHIVSFNRMFSGATSFNGNVENWNTESATDMTQMFSGASSFNRDLSGWNTAEVTSMRAMFSGATSFNGNISGWNTAKVNNMNTMFFGATAFNQDISDWGVSLVADFLNFLSGATSFSANNYDSLLTDWSGQSLQSGRTFGAPPTTYCSGEAGKTTLTDVAGHNWTINGDSGKFCPLVLTFDTTLGSGGTMITVPMNGVHLYDVDIDNDGDFTDAGSLINVSGSRAIDLGTAGVHTIRIRPNPTNNVGKQLRIRFAGGNDAEKLTSIEQWGDIVWTSMESAFFGCSNMNISTSAGAPNFSQVTNANAMFRDATTLNQDLSGWNVAAITNMNYMFAGTSVFNGNITNWNTSSVTGMAAMFYQASAFNQAIGGWNTSKVIFMNSMFSAATKFNQDVGGWDVSKVTQMNNMFQQTDDFNQDLSNWNTSGITGSMAFMFNAAKAFNGNITNWNVSGATDMQNMFSGAAKFNRDLNWNTGNVTDMRSMFSGATDFNGNVSTWNTAKVTKMLYVFSNATSFNQDIGDWNVSAVDDMTGMMFNTTSFSTENYDKLLTGWGSRSVQSPITFRAPPTTFCAGAVGRKALIDAGWTIEQDAGILCSDHLVLTFNTTTDAPGNKTIDLPVSGVAYDVDIDGDGVFGDTDDASVVLENLTVKQTITFATAGEHTIRVRPNPVNNLTKQLRINFAGDATKNPQKLTSVEQWGDIVWTTMDNAFHGCSNMNISASAGIPDLSQVQNMAFMFQGATTLNQDLSGWNVSAATNMQGLFFEATTFNGNVSTWNVENVTNMGYLFGKATVFNQPLNSWNVSKVLYMTGMFELTDSFSQDLDNWNVSSVISMISMFSRAKAFTGNISTWNTGNVENMDVMFWGATLFNGNIGSWNTGKVTNMHTMFKEAVAFNQDLSNWNVSAVENMDYMFSGATAFNGNVSTWNTSNVTEMIAMFHTASVFNQDISGWNTSKVTLMNSMFSAATKFNQDVGGWDVSQVTQMNNMFQQTDDFDQDLSGWDTSGITGSMAFMFNGAKAFNGNIEGWNVSGATNMSSMFNGALKFNHDLNWNTGNVTDMTAMFSGAADFNGNVSTWNTGKVVKMLYMFSNASSFNQDVSAWNIPLVDDMTGMFANTTSFSSVNYNALLIGWGAQTVQPNVPFRAPSASYCSGKAGRKNLTDANWQITGDTESCSDFILKYDTTAEGNSADTTVQILMIEGAYDIDIDNDGDFTDTGDGGAIENLTGAQTIDFGSPGEKTIRIRPNPDNNLESKLHMRNLYLLDARKLMRVENWGNTIVWSSMATTFSGCENLTIAPSAGVPNLSMVTDMSQMFSQATNFNEDLSSWNVSNVINMTSLFSGADTFNGNISSWNTASVTNMTSMFQNAVAFNGDITGWNTSKVTLMNSMFSGATVFNSAIGVWDVSNVGNMSNTFGGATTFNQPLNSWNVSKVSSMSDMFAGAAAFNQPLNNWNVSTVSSMGDMFNGASIFNQDIGSWNTANVTFMREMFQNAAAFNQDLSAWNIERVSFMERMFQGVNAYSAENYDKLLISWSGQSVQSNVPFGAPPTNYCDGAAGRKFLDDAIIDGGKNWDITGDLAVLCPDLTLTYNTTQGDPGNTTIIIPMVDDGVGRYDVDLDNDGDFTDTGDGGALVNVIGVQTIDFGVGNGGEKTIRIRPNPTSNTSNQLRIAYANGNSAQKLLRIDNWGTTIVWSSMENAFNGCSNLEIPTSSGTPNLSMVTSMKSMFENATTFNNDINVWNTSNVEDMSFMFKNATTFNQNLNAWNTSKVTDMSEMFHEASAFNGVVSGWNTASVTNMYRMFRRASEFNQALNGWNTSNVTTIRYMFSNASKFNQPLNNWNTAKVENMSGVFAYAYVFHQDLHNWDTSNVLSMEDMFYDATVFNGNISTWNTAKVTHMAGMFGRAISFNGNINGWETGNVVEMYDIFYGATAFNQPLNNWDVSKVTSFYEIFYQATSFNQDLNSWNVENVTDMSSAFEEATSFNGNLSGWNPKNVEDMGSMFAKASAFNQDISAWNVTKVSEMQRMFSQASVFNQKLNTWDVSNVTNMSAMFRNATAFNQDISAWNIVKVADFGSFFNEATSFSSGNYDKLLIAWSNLDVIDGRSFSEPPTNYCIGEAGRSALTSDQGWSFNNNATKSCPDVILTFNTELGAPGNATIIVPMTAGAYDIDINNDGVYGDSDFASPSIPLNNLTGTQTITFENPGIYTVRIRPVGGNQLHLQFGGGNAAQKLLRIDTWGDAVVWSSMEGTFDGCANMTIPDTAGTPNLSAVTNMATMFQNASSFNTNISSWNIATVTNMTDAMTGATGFSTENYDALLTGWSAITTQTNVPFGAPPTTYCAGTPGRIILENLNWTITGDAPSCPEMVLRFSGSTITLPISGGAYDVDFNNDAVYDDTDAAGKPLDNLTGTQVITFSGSGTHIVRIRPNAANNPTNQLRIAYAGANDVTKLREIISWGTIVWTSMEQAFQGCQNLTIASTAGNPDLSMVTSMSKMFMDAYFFNSNINSWNVSNVQDMSYLFESGYYNQPLNNWNVSNVTNMSYMFGQSRDFNQDISMWNTSNATDMSFMFEGSSLFNQNIGNWDVSKVTTMQDMFEQAGRFNQDLSNWNISNVTVMNNFLRSTSFSAENYDKLLIGWSALPSVKSNITFTLSTNYCAGSGGRATLDETYNWTFNDGNSSCDDMQLWFLTAFGDPGGRSITLPISDGAYDIDINNDGLYDDNDRDADTNELLLNLTGTKTINFSGAGYIPIRIRPNPTNNPTNRLRITYAGANDAQKLRDITNWGNNIVWTSMANAFEGCTQLEFTATSGVPNLSIVTDMSYMFSGASAIDLVGNWNWDTSNVTNMEGVFYQATSFNSNIASWNTSKVTLMNSMFEGATLFNQNLNTWDTSLVTNMASMFKNAAAFNQDLNNWNTSAASNMNSIFSGATAFNGNISNWNVSGLNNMDFMFQNATAFNQSLNDWNVSGIQSMQSMFSGASSFNQNIGGWNVSSLTDMHSMFLGASAFNQNLNTWNVSNVTRMFQTFSGATAFNGNIGSWNTSKVTTMNTMFRDAVAFNQDLSNWNVSKVTTMNYMFSGATIFNGNVTNWNTESAESMAAMFHNASAFNQAIGNWNTSKVTLMNAMFSGATIFNQDLNSWDVSKVTSMGNMFQQTNDFNSNLSNWNTSSVVGNMGFMFNGATAFNQDISNWNVSGATNMASMFNGASEFNQDLNTWDTGNVTDMGAMFAAATDFNGNVSTWNTSKVTSMAYMFSNSTAFNQDIKDWNISVVGNMIGMFNNATSFSKDNYDSLLTGWTSRDVPDNITFGAPPTSYCNGEGGIDILTDDETNNWTINNNQGKSCEVKLSLKLFLRGAYDTNTGMMIDSLRAKNHIPIQTPHSDGISATASVFNTTGNDAIVDWVYVELRDKNDINTVLHGVSAFIQRDGDIVGADGSSEVSIPAGADDYHVTVSHRNHIPIATNTVISLSSTTTLIDLTKVENILGGSVGTMEISPGIRAVWGGDFNGDGQVKADDLLMGLAQGNLGTSGYRTTDFNMDGQAQSLELITTLLAAIGKGKQF